jgi:hypothetical protein
MFNPKTNCKAHLQNTKSCEISLQKCPFPLFYIVNCRIITAKAVSTKQLLQFDICYVDYKLQAS